MHDDDDDDDNEESSGLPNLGLKLVKETLVALNSKFTSLINSSLETSSFLDGLKKATLIPIPKKGSLLEVTNYRPIYLLPVPGKIIEKMAHNQISQHLEQSQLINDQQFGFRKGRSTTHAITQLVNHVSHSLNRKSYTVALFMVFKKSFDCLQYPKLLTKLEALGLDVGVIRWVADYLTNRQQTTFENNMHSDTLLVKQGVPQVSILGPLLYTIDIAGLITNTKATFYADDSPIYK